ncbi:hypothetical protein C8034_v004778 [Colletotrichum sidae]|uniref:Nephrocystin 3-like N-terminal domain-containing protein n=1 Tax=Colletotrichum sidae TaxID=1347389 RepID=A0A4R8T7W2_9PEZI|nr:hypothetical protein C8034_v004778 [Colletotrichum sidae]
MILKTFAMAAEIAVFIGAITKILDPPKHGHIPFMDTRDDEPLHNYTEEELAKQFPDADAAHECAWELLIKCRAIFKKLTATVEDGLGDGNCASQATDLIARVRNSASRDQRGSLWDQVDFCRARLDLLMGYLTSDETAQRVRQLVFSAENNLSRQEHIEECVRRLRQGVKSPGKTPLIGMTVVAEYTEYRQRLQRLLSIVRNIFKEVLLKSFLYLLPFDDMDEGFEIVPEAYRGTFDWAIPSSSADCFDEEKNAGLMDIEDSESEVAQDQRLAAWLAPGDASFHVVAMPGAGKSVLMKKMWSSYHGLSTGLTGCHTFIVVRYFFCKDGSPLQRSMEGMIRSLLYQILKAAPELAEVAFPKFGLPLDSPWSGVHILKRTLQSLRSLVAAFCALVTHFQQTPEPGGKKYWLVVFIDDLDHMEEPSQDFHTTEKSLGSSMPAWSKHGSGTPDRGHVKFCFSSRGLGQEKSLFFLEGLPRRYSVRLHDLTGPDMMHFLKKRLRRLQYGPPGSTSLSAVQRGPDDDGYENEELQSLCEKIVARARCSFLWVDLVVRYVLQQADFGNGPSDRIARERMVDDLPDDVDELRRQVDLFFSADNVLSSYSDYLDRLEGEARSLG